MIKIIIALIGAWLAITNVSCKNNNETNPPQTGDNLITGNFYWETSQPVLAVNPKKLPPSPENPWHAIKDPSIVFYKNQWHLFCTLRKKKGNNGLPPGYIRIGYMSFSDWKDAHESQWRLLDLGMDYHGAPQVFFFTPQQKWYLVYQFVDRYHNKPYGPYYSTTCDIADPALWTTPAPFYPENSTNAGTIFGLDYWIICDEDKAYLFFTSDNGLMWRAETDIQSFPHGFGKPEVALRADIMEASHTYRLKGLNKYLTIVEAEERKFFRFFRYYKAFMSDSLDGKWLELSATADKPFTGVINVRINGPQWTNLFGHGELLRTGYDEYLEVDPRNLRFLFQGGNNKFFGNVPFKIGLLTPANK